MAIKDVTLVFKANTADLEKVKNKFNEINGEAKQQEGLLGSLRAKQKLLGDAINNATSTTQLKKYNQELRKTEQEITNLSNKGVSSFSKMEAGMVRMAGAIGVGFAIKQIVGNAISTIVDFEKSISSLSAITGATGKDLEKLKGIVLSTAKETKKGATEVAKAFELVASAKPELLQNAEALGAVTKAAITLSKASGLDLVSAVNATTTGLAQFNLGAEKSTYVIDAMAAGAKYGASAIPETSQALEKFGAVADSANISLVDSVALVQTLADKQLKGAESGTQLKNVILKLKNEGLGFVDGQFNMNAALEEARAKFDAIKDPVERSKEQTKLFGLESSVAGEILLANIPKFKGFQESISEVGGAAAQAVIQTDNVATKTEELGNQYDNLILSLNEGEGSVSKFLSGFIDMTSDALAGITALNKTTKEFIDETVNKAVGDIKNAASANAEETKAQFEKIGLSGDKLKESLLRASEQAKEFSKLAKERGDNDLAATYNQEAIKLKELANAKTEETDATDENTTSTDKNNKSKEKQAAATKKLAEEKQKLAKESRELLQDIGNEMLIDGVSKEIEIEKTKWDRKIQTAKEKFGEYSAVVKAMEAQKDLEILQITIDDDNKKAEKRAEIQKQIDDTNRANIQDDYERKRQDAMAAFDEEIELLDENKTIENELIIAKKQELINALAEIDAEETIVKEEQKEIERENLESENQAKIEAAIATANTLMSIANSLSILANANSREQKALTLVSIALDTARGIAAAVASGAGVPFPANIPAILSGVAAVLSGMASAKQALSSTPKFKDGVIDLQGKGTATSDSIDAKLSVGESVMTAKETDEHGGILYAIRNKKLDEYLQKEYLPNYYMKQIKSKGGVEAKHISKQKDIQFPKGFKVTNARDINKPLIDVIKEQNFLNQNGSWQ